MDLTSIIPNLIASHPKLVSVFALIWFVDNAVLKPLAAAFPKLGMLDNVADYIGLFLKNLGYQPPKA